MSTNENTGSKDQGSADKIHNWELGETKDFDNLAYDKDKNTYKVDVKDKNEDYDHPFPYETPSENGADFNSDYDEANPYVGDEYANKEDKIEDGLEDLGMHVDKGESVRVKPEDDALAHTPEDDRTDLDEEGYPINDTPEK